MLTGKGVTPAPLSVRAYARHRKVSAPAVLRAIKAGRLKASLVVDAKGKHKIADVALADAEWAANTDLTKAPTAVKARGGDRDGVTPVTPETADEAADEANEGEPVLTPAMSLADAARVEKYWSARKKQLEVQTRAGELVPAKAVAAKIVGVFTLCRTKLLGIPSKAKTALPQLSNQDIAVLDRLIREALEDLASEQIGKLAA